MIFISGYVFTIEKNIPAVLVGDFNMSLKKIKTYISNNFPNWYIAPLYDNKFTYAKGTRSSCIDHVIYNEALAAHFNSFTSLYCVSKEFNIPPLSAKCAIAQVKGFKKWKNSNCIIFDLLRFIYHVVDVII